MKKQLQCLKLTVISDLKSTTKLYESINFGWILVKFTEGNACLTNECKTTPNLVTNSKNENNKILPYILQTGILEFG